MFIGTDPWIDIPKYLNFWTEAQIQREGEVVNFVTAISHEQSKSFQVSSRQRNL